MTSITPITELVHTIVFVWGTAEARLRVWDFHAVSETHRYTSAVFLYLYGLLAL